MNPYFIKYKRRTVTTLIIAALLIPSIITVILFLNNVTELMLAASTFYAIGLSFALMIIFIPYFMNKKLIAFVSQPSIQNFLSDHFTINETVSKTDSIMMKGFYNDLPFNLTFRIDSQWALSLDAELECVIDFMINKNKKQRSLFTQSQSYQIVPTQTGLIYHLSFDKKPIVQQNELKEICEYLLKNASQNNFKVKA